MMTGTLRPPRRRSPTPRVDRLIAGMCGVLALGAACGAPAPDVAPDAPLPLVDGAPSRVGQVATLTTHAHGVRGTVEVVDARTLVVRDFWFDGDGLSVFFYLGRAGTYAGGRAVGADLLRAKPYEGETITLALPADVTVDDFDGISVWCVPAGANFGDGLFAPP